MHFVGAYGAGDISSEYGRESVTRYTRFGSTWLRQARIVAEDDGLASNGLTFSVAAERDNVFVGAHQYADKGALSGSTYTSDYDAVPIEGGGPIDESSSPSPSPALL